MQFVHYISFALLEAKFTFPIFFFLCRNFFNSVISPDTMTKEGLTRINYGEKIEELNVQS